MEPITWINLGFCLIVFGVIRHFSEGPSLMKVDSEYLYFDVDIAAGQNPEGEFAGRIVNKASSTFTNVDSWFSQRRGEEERSTE